ncbi:MAG TPA: NADPH-dependent FMN reductase [Solirubrobacterales bacterium]|nr:NADPH-dependent FMN reductase [Solirubrobacterales bacterium]
MGKRIRLLILLGSVTAPGRLQRALADAVARSGAENWIEAELIDLADYRLDFVGRPGEAEDDREQLVEAVAEADAVVFATPVYRGSMSGALKNLFDLLPVEALESKPAGIVAMGASAHHFLGAERHLRDVLSFFGALQAPVAVYLTSADFDEGVPTERAEAALDELFAGVGSIAMALPTAWQLGPQPLAARKVPVVPTS